MVMIWGLPASALAQSPLTEDAKKRIVEHLQSLVTGDPALLDPPDPVRIEMLVWGNDAITNTIREEPSEKVIYLHGEYGRVGSRDRAFLPSGELSDLVINTDYAINAQAAWRHVRDKVEIGSKQDANLDVIPKLITIQRDTLRTMLFQGLYIHPNQVWDYSSIDGDGKGWSVVWVRRGDGKQMLTQGTGETPDDIRLHSISFREGHSGEPIPAWKLSLELSDHAALPWRTVQFARSKHVYSDGRLLNRIEVKSLDILDDPQFAEAIRTPDPHENAVPDEVTAVVDNRGLHVTEWTREDDALVEGPSKIKVGKIIVYISVAAAAIAGTVVAVVIWRRGA